MNAVLIQQLERQPDPLLQISQHATQDARRSAVHHRSVRPAGSGPSAPTLDGMRYIDVEWFHTCAEDPVRLVSELDLHGWETRKLEFFRDGSIGCASASQTWGKTRLGKAAVPDLKEINADAQFRGVETNEQEFEILWRRYASNDA